MRTENKAAIGWLNGGMILLAALAVLVIALAYLNNLERGLRAETSQTLREASAQSLRLLRERLGNDAMQLENAAEAVENSYLGIHAPSVLQSLYKRTANSNFELMAVVDADGMVYAYQSSRTHSIAGQEAFQRAMEGEQVLQAVVFEGRSLLVSLAPVRKGGKVEGVVLGLYGLEEISQLLQAEYFQGQGYCYVAKAGGEVFLRPKHAAADQEFTDIPTGLTDSQFFGPEGLPEMLRNMRDGKGGEVHYTWNNVERIMNYQPVGVNDWYLLSVVPQAVVTSRLLQLFRQAAYFVCGVMFIFVLLLTYTTRQRRKSQLKLEKAHEELITIYNALPGGVFRCLYDARWTVVFANEGFYRFIGYTRQEFQERFNNQMAGVIYPDDLEQIAQTVSEQIRHGNTVINENRLVCADGSIKWIWINCELSNDEHGLKSFYCTFTDITPQKVAQEQALLNQQRYEIVMEQTQDTVFEWNIRDRTIYHSKNFRKKFGYKPVSEHFPEDAVEAYGLCPEDAEAFLTAFRRIEQGEKYSVGEFRMRNAGDEYIWCKVTVTAIRGGDGKPFKAVGILSDIQEQKQQLLAIEESARRDSLTRLYNKGATAALTGERIAGGLERAVLLMVDVDNFKTINDTFGHTCGDMVLRSIADRLGMLFRSSDIVGRIGGDEFVAFLPGAGSERDALLGMARAVVRIFSEPFVCGEYRCEVTCSVGIALYPENGRNYDELFLRADKALYLAKGNGKNQYCIYDERAAERPSISVG